MKYEYTLNLNFFEYFFINFHKLLARERFVKYTKA